MIAYYPTKIAVIASRLRQTAERSSSGLGRMFKTACRALTSGWGRETGAPHRLMMQSPMNLSMGAGLEEYQGGGVGCVARWGGGLDIGGMRWSKRNHQMNRGKGTELFVAHNCALTNKVLTLKKNC